MSNPKYVYRETVSEAEKISTEYVDSLRTQLAESNQRYIQQHAKLEALERLYSGTVAVLYHWRGCEYIAGDDVDGTILKGARNARDEYITKAENRKK